MAFVELLHFSPTSMHKGGKIHVYGIWLRGNVALVCLDRIAGAWTFADTSGKILARIDVILNQIFLVLNYFRRI